VMLTIIQIFINDIHIRTLIFILHFSIFIESGKEVTEGDEDYRLVIMIIYSIMYRHFKQNKLFYI